MEFGRVPNVDAVDFSYPVEPASNAAFLGRNGGRAAPGDVLLGLPGWGDRGFVGRLYGQGTRPERFLEHYAGVFPAAELNTTYYGSSAQRLARWASQVPESFRFCPKLPADITHELQLHGADAAMGQFVEQLGALGPRIGRVWGVLPPGFAPDRIDVLDRFLTTWAPRVPLALELRHPDWFSSEQRIEHWASCMRHHGVTAVISDVAGRRDVLHMRLTAADAFVRFVGNNRHPSDQPRLVEWARRVANWREAGLGRTYLFLHQKADPDAVDLARDFSGHFEQRTQEVLVPGLREPLGRPGGTQGELF